MSTTSVAVNGPAIREIRSRSSLDMAELAARVGVERAYITKLELGHSRRVSPKVFNALVAALSITDRRALMAQPYGDASEEDAA